MKKIDPLVAMARQQRLASAARGAVDACLRGFTSVDAGLDAGLPDLRSDKTNPIHPAHGTAAPAQVSDRAAKSSGAAFTRGSAPQSPSIHSSGGVDGRLPALTPVDRGLPKPPLNKTNPFRIETPAAAGRCLSPQQLAAARLLARGGKPADVAAALRITRQGLWKWRRLPAFAQELDRLHELLARQPDAIGRGPMR